MSANERCRPVSKVSAQHQRSLACQHQPESAMRRCLHTVTDTGQPAQNFIRSNRTPRRFEASAMTADLRRELKSLKLMRVFPTNHLQGSRRLTLNV